MIFGYSKLFARSWRELYAIDNNGAAGNRCIQMEGNIRCGSGILYFKGKAGSFILARHWHRDRNPEAVSNHEEEMRVNRLIPPEACGWL
jgi:hypothetical protein